MKTGVIVYVPGENLQAEALENDVTLENMRTNIGADMVTLVSQRAGHFSIDDAWRFLLVKGMQRIICVIAEYTAAGVL